ncbi:MFS transporter [Fusibacter bizertensis]
MKNSRLIIWGNYFGFVLMGMIVISFGATMPYIRREFGLSFEQGGLILALFSGSYLMSGLISGLLVDKVGHKRVLIGGNLGYIVGLSTLASSIQLTTVYLGVLILGMGWGICNSVVNILVNDSSRGDSKAMSLLHMSFGVGAFIVPLLFNSVLTLGYTWKRMMWILAVMALIAEVLVLKMQIPFIRTVKNASEKDFKIPWRYISVYMFVLFFYVGVENAFSGWMVSYLETDLKFSEGFSQGLLSTLWLTIILGRFITGTFGRKMNKSKFIVSVSASAFVGMFIFLVSTSAMWIAFSVVCIGLSLAGIYPLTMADANRHIHGSGIATAIVISGGGIGATIMPYLTGKLADQFGAVAIIGTILVSTGFMILFSVVNFKQNKSV